jgi:hypothetical protein
MYLADMRLPLAVSVPLFYFFAIYGISKRYQYDLAIYRRLSVLVYFLPFLTTLGYLIVDNYVWDRNLLRIIYMQNIHVVENMVLVGLVGFLGLQYGFNFSVKKIENMDVAKEFYNHESFDCIFFGVFTLIACIFSYLFTPQDTILNSSYGGFLHESVAQNINFNSAGMLSYCFMIMLYIDILLSSRKNKKIKNVIFFMALFVIVVVFEFLRGNRDCIALVASLFAMYIAYGKNIDFEFNASFSKKKIKKVILPALVVFVLFISIGSLRYIAKSSDQYSLVEHFVNGIATQSTWDSILLTNLDMAWKFHYNLFDYLYGKTYVDYLLSLPPGMITKTLGIVRPLETTQGPAWWFDISRGGIHVVLVPFRNFGIFGCFVVMSLIGYYISWVENNKSRSIFFMFAYGVSVAGLIKWFWYGDMYFVRALMAGVIVYFVYKFSLKFYNEVF